MVNNYKVIGLHNHLSSLPIENKIRFLDECLECNANIISITDHRTLSSYYYLFSSLTEEQLERYKNIKFVIGMELTGNFEFLDNQVISMDLLCYNIDLNKYHLLWNFIKEKYSNSMNTPEFQKKELERLIEVSKSLGFMADYDSLEINKENPFAGTTLARGLIDERYRNYNIKKGLEKEVIDDPRCFFNRYCKTNTPFHLDTTVFFPNIQDVINAVKNSGAIPVLDHPAAYFPKDNKRPAYLNPKTFVIDFFNHTKGVQGLEIIHPSYTNQHDFYEFLSNYARITHLFTSGGTDYHQNGEPIVTDYNGYTIDNKRLFNFDNWAKIYSVYDILEIGRRVSEIEELPKVKTLV